ncbi:hypothetical protein E2C01_100140 [Portunus trituberculatus]|uniref:Uncharacterized protein n=1 Tax=Portunus trituberculatus TaxID=210409 RepID=A0A5B7KH68_PORTR|nr:hypothetical protein [Portunus trituberculatus]
MSVRKGDLIGEVARKRIT